MTLTIDDFTNPYNSETPINKIILGRGGFSEDAITGQNYSINFHKINFVYYTSDGAISFHYFDVLVGKNIKLSEKKIRTAKDFEKEFDKADKKIYSYLSKN
jgi:hypothetical protein